MAANDYGIQHYRNGAQIGTVASANGSGSMAQTGGDFRLGGNGTANKSLAGKLDDVRVYDRVLSAVEVAQLYNGGAGCP